MELGARSLAFDLAAATSVGKHAGVYCRCAEVRVAAVEAGADDERRFLEKLGADDSRLGQAY